MTNINNRLFLKEPNNIIFTNNFLHRTIYCTKNKFNIWKKNKNQNLNKNTIIDFNINSSLKNINKDYIERNILQNNNKFISTSQQTNSSIINDNNNNKKLINKIKTQKHKSFHSRNDNYLKIINFKELIKTNDIDLKSFNFPKISNNNNSTKNIKNTGIQLKKKLIEKKPKKLLTSELVSIDQYPDRIRLKRLKINHKYKTKQFKDNTTKKVKTTFFNKMYNSEKNNYYMDKNKYRDYSELINSMTKINKDKSTPNFFLRLNKNLNINLTTKLELNKK